MKLVIRKTAPKPTGENDPDVIQKVVAVIEEGRPVTAAAIGKRLHLCELAVSRIICKHYGLNECGPASAKRVIREWAPVHKEMGRIQETLFTLRPVEAVIEE